MDASNDLDSLVIKSTSTCRIRENKKNEAGAYLFSLCPSNSTQDSITSFMRVHIIIIFQSNFLINNYVFQ